MVKHQTRNILFIVFAIIIIGSMIFFLFPAQASGEITFSIPSLSVINATVPEGEVPVGEIVCKIRQITKVIGSNGQTLNTIESDSFLGSPTFSRLQFTIDPQTQTDISHFTVEPRILCIQENGLPILITTPNQNFVVSVNARFCALDGAIEGLRATGGGTVGCTGNNFLFSERLPINSITFNAGDGEKSFGIGIIRIEEIERFAPEEDLDTRLEFNAFGNIIVAYQNTVGCPNCSDFSFNFDVPFRTLNTFYDILVLKEPPPIIDTDNDGIVDSSDGCPNDPENFNGFEDTDGCPDIRPADSTEAVIVDEDPIDPLPTQITTESDPIIIVEGVEISEPSLIEQIIDVIIPSPVVEVTEPTEVIRLEDGIVVTTDPITGEITTRLVTELPLPVFELQQEIPEPQQLPSETREIRPPMADDTILIVIVILIVGGLIAIVIISRFTKL